MKVLVKFLPVLFILAGLGLLFADAPFANAGLYAAGALVIGSGWIAMKMKGGKMKLLVFALLMGALGYVLYSQNLLDKITG